MPLLFFLIQNFANNYHILKLFVSNINFIIKLIYENLILDICY